MKKNFLSFLISLLLSIFIVAGPTVFLVNLLIYYSYLFWTISGLILLAIIFIILESRFYCELTKESFNKKYYILGGIIVFIILEIVLMIIYPRIF